MTVNLDGLDERELYRLAFEVSERLVAIEVQKMTDEVKLWERDTTGGLVARVYVPDSADDNYGGW